MNYQLSQESLDFGNSFQPAATDHEQIIMALHHEIESLKEKLNQANSRNAIFGMVDAALIIEDLIQDESLPDWKAYIVSDLISQIFSANYREDRSIINGAVERLKYREKYGDWPENNDDVDYCTTCHGAGEYQTASGWHPCAYCKGKGKK